MEEKWAKLQLIAVKHDATSGPPAWRQVALSQFMRDDDSDGFIRLLRAYQGQQAEPRERMSEWLRTEDHRRQHPFTFPPEGEKTHEEVLNEWVLSQSAGGGRKRRKSKKRKSKKRISKKRKTRTRRRRR